MRRFIKLIKEKWLRETSLTILLVAIILFAFIIINLIFRQIDIAPIDFTQEKIYSLSQESKDRIKDVNQNVDIYFFGYDEASTAVILGKQYEDINDKIEVKILKTSERPDLVAQYGISSSSQVVVVTSSHRYKAIDASEMYTYDTTTYDTIDITEQKLTSAILDVTISKKPQVYFLTGHGEYGIDSSSAMYYLAQYITNEVNDVSTLDLITSSMPEQCDLLIIANPTKDFTDDETEKLQTYINHGGKIIWMQDPYIGIKNYKKEDFPNTNKILANYGISFSKGIVCEASTSNMAEGAPDLIIPSLTYNNIVKDIYTDGKIILPDAGKINFVSDEKLEKLNVTVENFVKSTENSFYKENVEENLSYLTKSKSDEEGPFVLGTILTKKVNDETTSTLIAYSNAFFATNYQIIIGNGYSTPIALRNNKDILLNSVAYLTNREDSIRIRKNTGVVEFATATQQQAIIVMAVIFIIPVAIIIIGIIITIIRKRRK